MSVAFEKELKVFEYTEWPHYYYLVSFDCFPFLFCFSYFSDSTYSLTKGVHRQKAGRGHSEGEGPRTAAPAPSHFSLSSQSRANVNAMGNMGLEVREPGFES